MFSFPTRRSPWTTWTKAQWQDLCLGGLDKTMSNPGWLLEKGDAGRSLLMTLLANSVHFQETERVFEAASTHPQWRQCQQMEDADGVRLPAYMLRHGLKRYFSSGTWADAVFDTPEPVSSQGHGVLRQMATLARKTSQPNHWVLDLLMISPKACAFSPHQWQAGLDEPMLRAWLFNRVFAINPKTHGSISGPATPDLHFFYNILVHLKVSLEDGEWLSQWSRTLEDAIKMAALFCHCPPSGSPLLRQAAKKKRWEMQVGVVERLFDCIPPGGGVIRAVLEMAGDEPIWDEMIARVQSNRCAALLGAALPGIALPPVSIDDDTDRETVGARRL